MADFLTKKYLAVFGEEPSWPFAVKFGLFSQLLCVSWPSVMTSIRTDKEFPYSSPAIALVNSTAPPVTNGVTTNDVVLCSEPDMRYPRFNSSSSIVHRVSKGGA